MAVQLGFSFDDYKDDNFNDKDAEKDLSSGRRMRKSVMPVGRSSIVKAEHNPVAKVPKKTSSDVVHEDASVTYTVPGSEHVDVPVTVPGQQGSNNRSDYQTRPSNVNMDDFIAKFIAELDARDARIEEKRKQEAARREEEERRREEEARKREIEEQERRNNPDKWDPYDRYNARVASINQALVIMQEAINDYFMECPYETNIVMTIYKDMESKSPEETNDLPISVDMRTREYKRWKHSVAFAEWAAEHGVYCDPDKIDWSGANDIDGGAKRNTRDVSMLKTAICEAYAPKEKSSGGFFSSLFK